MKTYICCICGKEFEDYGNNPEPAFPSDDGAGNENRCCDVCNEEVVIPARIEAMRRTSCQKSHGNGNSHRS